MSKTPNRRRTAPMHRAVIITALPVEYAAVRTHLTELYDEEHPQGDIYEQGMFKTEHDAWRVGIVEIGAGNPGAAQKTERAIAHFDPQVVLFVGVAGGIKDVAIGDVVVATKVYGYHSGKAEAEFRTRPELGLPGHRLLERARSEARRVTWLRRLAEPPKRTPRVLLGPIAAGEQVVASKESETYWLIRASYGDTLAVEMESYGFLKATQAFPNLGGALVIRGISDLIEGKTEADQSGSQELASQHAAAFAFEVLARLNLPGRPLPKVRTKPPKPSEPQPPKRSARKDSEPQLPAIAKPTPYQLRPPVADFVGREHEIARLSEALQGTEQSGTMVILRGLGGAGKTELAYAVAQHLEERFPDGQVFLELRGASDTPLPAEQALQRVTQAFNIQAQVTGELDQLQARYRSELHRKRVLILADDASNAEQVRRLMPPAGCALIVTTRERFTLPGATTFDLHTLSEDAAATLVQQICPRIGPAAPQLARLCGCLPLALRVSASVLLNDDTREVETYLDTLADERTRLIHMQVPNDSTLDVEAALQLSYRAMSLAAQTALRHISVFSSNFDLEAAKAVVDLGKIKLPPAQGPDSQKQKGRAAPPPLDEVLSELYHRSLVDYDTATRRYTLHELVRTFGAQQLTASERGRFRRYAIYYSGIAAMAEALYRQGGEHTMQGLALFDQERVHIDTALNWLRRIQDDELLLIYAQTIGDIGLLRYHPRSEMLPLGKELLAAAQRRNRRNLQAVSLNLLGNAYLGIGEMRQAAECYTGGLTIVQSLHGRKRSRPLEAAFLNNLSVVYSDLGENHRAIELLKQSLVIQRELDNRWTEASCLDNLGRCYADLGNFHRAIELHQQSLTMASEQGHRRNQARSLSNLGRCQAHLGDLRQAIELHQQALWIEREIGNRDDEAANLGVLGWCYAQLGYLPRAIELHQQNLWIERELGNRQREAISLSNLCLCNAYQGETVWAIELGEEALQISQELSIRPTEGYAQRCLGVAYAAAGKIDQAIGAQERAVTIARIVEDPNLEGMALNHLGEVYLQQSELQRAQENFEQARSIMKKIGNRQYEAISSWNMGEVLIKQGNIAQTVELMQLRIDFERDVGHAQLETHAQRLAEVRESVFSRIE